METEAQKLILYLNLVCGVCQKDFQAKDVRHANLIKDSQYGIECPACAEERATEWSKQQYEAYLKRIGTPQKACPLTNIN